MRQIGHVLVIVEAEWIRFTKVFSQLLWMHGSFPSLNAFKKKKEDSSIPHSKFIKNQLLLQFFKKVHKESHFLRHGKYQHKKLKTFVSPPSPTNPGHVSLLWFPLKLPALPGIICLFHHLFSLASSLSSSWSSLILHASSSKPFSIQSSELPILTATCHPA